MRLLQTSVGAPLGGISPESAGDDEPEALVLLVACGIGLCTGGGVVLFNWAIHSIQEVAWGPVILSQVSGNVRSCDAATITGG